MPSQSRTDGKEQQSLLGGATSFLVNPQFLRTRLLVYASGRFGVAAAIVMGAWFAPAIVGIEGLPIGGLLVLAATLVAFNTVVFSLLFWRSWGTESSYRHLMLLMHATISLDFVFLTGALWLVGGAASPFASFYILHIILAAMLLPRTDVFFQTLFGYLLFAGLVISQWLELAPVFTPVGAIVSEAPINGRYAITVLTVQAILFVVTMVLVSEIAAALKRGERALSALNAELEQLSEMRRDFLYVVTHNLKAPAAAATMLLETVDTLWSAHMPEEGRNALQRARARTQELSDLVMDMQQLTALESGALHKQEQPVNLNEVARKLATAYQDPAERKKQQILLELDESLPDIQAVPRLIHEAAVNYVTNAIKYTPEGGRIILRTRKDETTAAFEVEDTGAGIPAEYLEKLFGTFVRVPVRVSGHRPPGIGLGLFIVKRIVQYYDGNVYVSSEPGKGSRFGFTIPVPPVDAAL